VHPAILKLIGTTQDGTKVYIVDGNIVRHMLDTAFTQGGHGYVYKYIPKDEIWVEKVVNSDDQRHNMAHEMEEYDLMKYRGLTYAKAHKIAIEDEAVERAKCNPF
jgi:hypothetical protein